ncbi:hypothetical protein Ahy_A03g012151 [Arachis hypogaea]|uniref:Uncharacterized protein n=1 Tax=Arachis hypogaea TaxID=3818 RepID=A0A445DSL7_ARAHY|nr:hypothetical protein Ahy_A03g012151 [Arachis hypogaea]
MPFMSRCIATIRVQLDVVASPSKARTERDASEKGDECEKGDAEEGLPPFCLAAVELLQPPRLVSIAAKLQPPPSLLGSLSLLNEEGEFESASEGRKKESR